MPPELLKKHDAYWRRYSRWSRRNPHAAVTAGLRAEREAERLHDERSELRRDLLAIPARSPRGLLIKFALAVEAETLDEIEKEIERLDGDWAISIAADLRAMTKGAA